LREFRSYFFGQTQISGRYEAELDGFSVYDTNFEVEGDIETLFNKALPQKDEVEAGGKTHPMYM
jgi:hypothetical protein